MPEFDGQSYKATRGSDIDRDGMYLELADARGEVVAEVFYSDVTGKMTLQTFGLGLPLEAAEWLVEAAKRGLPPVN